MKLSNHQIKIATVVYNKLEPLYAGEAGVQPFTDSTLNGWLSEGGVSTVGKAFLKTWFKNGNYNLDWAVGLDLVQFVAYMRRYEDDKSLVQTVSEPTVTPKVDVTIKSVETKSESSSSAVGYYIPSKVDGFVRFGEMTKVDKIIKSGAFLPTYIYGDTGLAKSMSVIQACASAKRELFRINVNINTDEEDFIGGFRLVDGETVFQKGPLVLAMERGAVLLIDEISALSPSNAFCLFSVLEGGELYIKKTNEKITPAPGFNIIATDNTKGKGTSSGRFVGTNVQNDAFLDRFVVALEYGYPTPAMELKILNAVDNTNEANNKELITWANVVRNSFADGVVDETISVRKLVSILTINKVFGNIKQSVQMALGRYEDETKTALIDLLDKVLTDPEYEKIDFESTDNAVDVAASTGGQSTEEYVLNTDPWKEAHDAVLAEAVGEAVSMAVSKSFQQELQSA